MANQESSRSISEKIWQKLLNEQTIERYKAEKLDVLSYADLTHRIIQYPDEGSRFTTEREDSSGIIFETEKSLPQFNVINKSSEESIDMKIAGTRTEMPDIARIADQVYKRIEDRLRVERQRRGLFR